MSYIIERIGEPLILGEGPHWDDKTEKLYYVDILKSAVYSYDPKTKKVSKAIVGNGEKTVSIIVPVENESNKFVISFGNDIATITWDGSSDSVSDLKIICSSSDPYPEIRINDGKCSPSGILLAGSMEANITLDGDSVSKGSLYAFKNDKITLLDQVKISNGLAWSADEKKLYYIDSLLFRIDSFDFNAANPELTNRKTVFDFKANKIPGLPDGMTIDKDGFLWVAVFQGSRVIKIDPTNGVLVDTITFPTPRITSVAFGGQNLDELYVTSAIKGNELEKPSSDVDHDAGCIFKVTRLQTKGFSPGVPMKLQNIPPTCCLKS